MGTPKASAGALFLPNVSTRKHAAGEARAVRVSRRKQRILNEEEYIERLQTIIQRDFFPNVEKLQTQKEYLDAEENGDLEHMRQIAVKFGSALNKVSWEPRPPYVTPTTFETPEIHPSSGVLGNKPQTLGGDQDDRGQR